MGLCSARRHCKDFHVLIERKVFLSPANNAIEAKKDEVLVVVAIAFRVDLHRPGECIIASVEMYEVLQILLIAVREVLHCPIVHEILFNDEVIIITTLTDDVRDPTSTLISVCDALFAEYSAPVDATLVLGTVSTSSCNMGACGFGSTSIVRVAV